MIQKTRLAASLAASIAILASTATFAELVSKKYEFKEGVTLEVGADTGDGLRIDTVRFQLPTTPGGRYLRTLGIVSAEVTVSNSSENSGKIGIAIALFDAEGRLVGAANGGTKLMPVKPGRQKTYTLIFEGVNSAAHSTTTFQISFESKP